MTMMQRYAVYFAPRPGAFADCAARWLSGGADPAEDRGLPRPKAELTVDPRKYGFHGTIRAPFRPAPAVTEDLIARTVAGLATRLAPVCCDGLQLQNMDGFLALTPVGSQTALQDMAAMVVEGTNTLRCDLTPTEVARRQPETLTDRQRTLLDCWGYPFVMEEFRFHLTLTGRLPANEAAAVAQVLSARFAPVLPVPFCIEDLCLFGEDVTGRFRLLHRYPLAG